MGISVVLDDLVCLWLCLSQSDVAVVVPDVPILYCMVVPGLFMVMPESE